MNKCLAPFVPMVIVTMTILLFTAMSMFIVPLMVIFGWSCRGFAFLSWRIRGCGFALLSWGCRGSSFSLLSWSGRGGRFALFSWGGRGSRFTLFGGWSSGRRNRSLRLKYIITLLLSFHN